MATPTFPGHFGAADYAERLTNRRGLTPTVEAFHLNNRTPSRRSGRRRVLC